MGGLIKAEFRKMFTTKMWWVLASTTVLLGLGWSWIFAAFGSALSNGVAESSVSQELGLDKLMFSVFGYARAVNITAVFPMVLGALAVTGEIHRKTITTSYLTGSSRGAVLTAKLMTYTLVGLAYGVLISGVASAGMALGSNSNLLPDANGWALLFLAGVISTLLWTLFGVGMGALLGNVFGAVIGLLVYSVVAENIVVLALPKQIVGFLPNGSADGLTGSIAAKIFLDRLGPVNPAIKDNVEVVAKALAGATGTFDWWISGLIFAGYVALALGGGWAVSRVRDIT